ncbi:MAG: metal-sensitive transcriptional regulator [Rhodospirillales bacterium]|nr:metal-sensitive transcriptional regulator [Rhodospirillales bacterium]MCB9995198.1 metal-sensitive transcriptional regulator [Rhodospirillales bacterium]
MPEDSPPPHPCHHAELPKLNRAAGQIEGVKRMIEEGRYCPDIITQLRAARAALRRIEGDILESHLQHCVADAMSGNDAQDTEQKIAELKELYKRFYE